jgi:hypothetical protein
VVGIVPRGNAPNESAAHDAGAVSYAIAGLSAALGKLAELIGSLN